MWADVCSLFGSGLLAAVGNLMKLSDNRVTGAAGFGLHRNVAIDSLVRKLPAADFNDKARFLAVRSPLATTPRSYGALFGIKQARRLLISSPTNKF